MKIMVLGGGLMGPAGAFNAMSDPDVAEVTLCDASPLQLAAARRKLGPLPGADKLATRVLDVHDQAAAAQQMAGFDVVLAALPRRAIGLGLRAAMQARVPLVDLNWPLEPEAPELERLAQTIDHPIILGCGVEPGLTEIMARHLAGQLDRVDELHIKCGGIPEQPAGPLGYKIVFGGRELPLHEADARWVENGVLKPVARYSGVEPVFFAGVGECEAWHEGFMPWLLKLPALGALKVGTQKTVRWPGYAAKATVLKELGLLGERLIDVDGMQVAPKRLLDALLYPRVRLEAGERDITVLRVEAVGNKAGQPRRLKTEMVDRYDPTLGFTSMARTTAFTGMVVARMIGRGDILARGWLTPEQVIAGPLLDRLVAELAEQRIVFQTVEEPSGA